MIFLHFNSLHNLLLCFSVTIEKARRTGSMTSTLSQLLRNMAPKLPSPHTEVIDQTLN